MFLLEPLFCPCCTPAVLHTLAQTDLTRLSQQMLWLGTGSLSLAIKQDQHQPQAPFKRGDRPIADAPIADDSLPTNQML